jgi:hypothetical protein
MSTTKLKGRITRDRRLVVDLPGNIAVGAVEVILLQPPRALRKSLGRGTAHPAFGIWADRTDIADTVSYAADIRRQVEMRSDAQHSR